MPIVITYLVNCNQFHYNIQILFKNKKELKQEIGYVTYGANLEDEIIIYNDKVEFIFKKTRLKNNS